MFTDFLTSPLFKNMIASTQGLERSTVAIQGVRLSPIMSGPSKESHVHAELNATGQAKKTKAAGPNSIDLEPYYSFVFATKVTRSDANPPSSSPLALVSKFALVADAGPARGFPIDPSSQKDAIRSFINDDRRDQKMCSTATVRQCRQCRRHPIPWSTRPTAITMRWWSCAPDLSWKTTVTCRQLGRQSIYRALDHRSDRTIPLRSWRTGTSNNSSTAFAHTDYLQTIISGSPLFHSRFTIAPESDPDRAKMARPSMPAFV